MPLLIVSQSDSLIQIVDINSDTDWQTVQIQISWLFQKPTDLDLHYMYLQRQVISGLSRTRVNPKSSNHNCSRRHSDFFFFFFFHYFWKKTSLTFQVNCLLNRQFTWIAKPYFPWKNVCYNFPRSLLWWMLLSLDLLLTIIICRLSLNVGICQTLFVAKNWKLDLAFVLF